MKAKIALTLFVPAALAIAMAGLAWACTPPDLNVNPSWIPSAGQQVGVNGKYMNDGPVELYLSGNGTSRHLATVNGPQFSTSVTIPSDVADGEYYVVAQWTATNEDGETSPESVGAALRVGEAAPEQPAPGGGGDKKDPASPASPANPSGEGTAGGSSRPEEAATSTAAAVEEPSKAPQSPVSASAAVRKGTRGDRRGDRVVERVPAAPWERLGAPAAGAPGADLFAEGEAPSFSASDTSRFATADPASPNYLAYGAILLSLSLIAILGGAGFVAVRARRAPGGRGER